MLIVALVLAVIGLAALVTAVVTSNELIAWVCIAASVIGVVLLIVDAVRERTRGRTESETAASEPSGQEGEEFDAEYPDIDADSETTAVPTESTDTEVTEDSEITEDSMVSDTDDSSDATAVHDATEVVEEDRKTR